ncbi:MAG TPA: acyl-CoA dehydrogenase family protein [Pseudonocardia sp.]
MSTDLSGPDREELTHFQAGFDAWLDEHAAELEPLRQLPEDLDEQFAVQRRLQRQLYDAGWSRYGWPERFGGLGGSTVVRGALAEGLTKRGYTFPFALGMIEVLAPAVTRFASAELAGQMFPLLLSGQELWCQGFSEPEAGSDLGSLRTRAVDEGEHWRVSGQKIWTSWAQYAQRCVLLVRTGEQADGFRGITALFVDMDSPGITVRPLRAMSGDEDFSELFFDDVLVPKSRTIGQVGAGAAVTMAVLENERGVLAWQRQTWLHQRLAALVGSDGLPPGAATRIGEVYAALYALKLRARHTFRSVVAGQPVGPQSSVDKILLSTGEKALFDAVFELLGDRALLGDDPRWRQWRYEHAYSRASSIYGGTAEVQRNILADRILALPRER